METLIDYIVKNSSWIFSGAGVIAVTGLFHLFKTRSNPTNKQIQKIKGSGTGYQASGDININKKQKK